jgi:cyclopropane fatty-acyl-phospholipid synthase-like methyltransferase
MNKWIYELFYRTPFVPISWIFGSPHEMKEYAELLESGRIPPGQAIDLGCGEGSNAIYLSKIGFDVTGVDFSPTAIKRARANARAEGLEVTFFEDDLTNLHQVSGKFDLLVDFGALNDLQQVDRDLYMQNVLPLTHTGSCFILMCFAKSVPAIEIERRFAQHFSIETLNKRTESATARSIVAYCMTRN